jgi:glucosamine kinase
LSNEISLRQQILRSYSQYCSKKGFSNRHRYYKGIYMMHTKPIIIGIDGGGTSCRVALRFGVDGPRHEVVLGPANVSTDFDAALQTIHAALDQMAGVANLPMRIIHSATAYAGLAGVMNQAIAARVAAALPFKNPTVTGDRPTTIAGALGESDGSVAAIGTGSFIGRQGAGTVQGLGGWGFYIGDQASGAWLFRRCLEQVMLCVDGLAPHTDLTRAVLENHDHDPGQIVTFSLRSTPADYARLARDVVAGAESGDPLGMRLMQEGADYIRQGLHVLGWQPGEPLCLTGGLGPAYARWLNLETIAPKGTALDGALALATRKAMGAT